MLGEFFFLLTSILITVIQIHTSAQISDINTFLLLYLPYEAFSCLGSSGELYILEIPQSDEQYSAGLAKKSVLLNDKVELFVNWRFMILTNLALVD